MFTISVTVKDGSAAAAKLDQIKGVLSDLSPELRLSGQFLIDFFKKEVFGSAGAVYGSRWAGLSHPYAEHKQGLFQRPPRSGVTRHIYPGRDILEASGRMRNDSWSLFVSARRGVVTNNAPYAAYHHYGTNRMPRRRFMIIDQTRNRNIADIFGQSLKERIKALF